MYDIRKSQYKQEKIQWLWYAIFLWVVSILGMYPQTVVPSGDTLHTTLTNGMDAPDSGVTLVPGVHYTANKDATAWDDNDRDNAVELNPVYEHDNKRYVRVTPYAYVKDSDDYKYNVTADNPNPERVDQCAWNDSSSQPDRLRWFKVEPIKWIILNFNQLIVKDTNDIVTDLPRLSTDLPMELYAADILMSGIQFNPAITGRTIWDQSSIYKYLNGDFYNQAFSDADKSQIKVSTIYNNNSDGTQYNAAAYGLNSNHFAGTGYNPTIQNIYLLSYYELSNANSPYVKATENPIFEDNGAAASTTRQAGGTDYARAHYLYLSGGFCQYWTRTALSGTNVYRVNSTGGFHTGSAPSASTGTRPALTIFCFALLSDDYLWWYQIWECTHKP